MSGIHSVPSGASAPCASVRPNVSRSTTWPFSTWTRTLSAAWIQRPRAPATNQDGARTPTSTRSILPLVGSSRAISVAARPKPTQRRAAGDVQAGRPRPDRDAADHPQRARVDLDELSRLPGRHPHAAEGGGDVERDATDPYAPHAARPRVDARERAGLVVHGPERAESVRDREEPRPELEPARDPVRLRVDPRERPRAVVRHPHRAVGRGRAAGRRAGLDPRDDVRRGERRECHAD